MNAEDNRLPPFMIAGWTVRIGEHTFTPEEIIAFAREYDPQPFHLSEEAGRNSVFGGLCASGWHTASMWMLKQREFMERHGPELQAAGYPLPRYGPSPGFRNLRWLKPVMAGETISFFNSTRECRPSGSRPGWHVMTGEFRAENAAGEIVMTFESTVFLTLS